ncbi:MAG: hypothetical protein ACLU99_08790 [Alphaproteobacteria bacterium]
MRTNVLASVSLCGRITPATPDYEGDFEISFTFYLKTLGGAASK